MPRPRPFILNERGLVMHDARHRREECNLDDTKAKSALTRREALEVLRKASWGVELCAHCWPDR